jgi:hypothetical protein
MIQGRGDLIAQTQRLQAGGINVILTSIFQRLDRVSIG